MKLLLLLLIGTIIQAGCNETHRDQSPDLRDGDQIDSQPRLSPRVDTPINPDDPDNEDDWIEDGRLESVGDHSWQDPTASQVLADLARACDAGGGKFDLDFQVCTCPRGQAYLGWNERQCQTPTEMTSCSESLSEILNQEQNEECQELMTFSQKLNGGSSSSTIVVEFSPSAAKNKRLWFANHIHELKNMLLQVANQPMGGLQTLLIGEQRLTNKELDDFFAWSDNYDLVGALREDVSLFEQTIHIPFEANPASRFELKEDAPDRYLDTVHVPRMTPILSHFPKIHKEVVTTRFEPTSQFIATEDGCLQYCRLTQKYPQRIDGYGVNRIRTYIGGALVKDWLHIHINDDESFPDGLITLTPSGHVSMMFAFETIKQEGQPLSRKRMGYDSTWKPLTNGWQQFPYSLTSTQDEELLSLSQRSEHRPFGPTGIICESGFTAGASTRIGMKNLLLGPYIKYGSIYGWFHSPSNTKELSDLYFSGTTLLDPYGLSNLRQNFRRVTHTETVARIFLQSATPGALIIPMGVEHCLSQLPRWLPTIKEHSKAKVISFSAIGYAQSHTLCASSTIKKNLQQANNDLLLVAGAGNDHSNLDVYNTGFCTQDMGPLPNVIQVGAGNPQGLASYSNYGTRTVDILADGMSPIEPGSRGTSFATPRVAGVAASLAHEFPTLTIPQLKLSILLGAQIPASPLPVISGGVLDSETARRFASHWSQQPSSKAQDLLRRVYGKTEAKRRLTLYRERGLKLKLQSQAGKNL